MVKQKTLADRKGVHCEVESEGSVKQNRIRDEQKYNIRPTVWIIEH